MTQSKHVPAPRTDSVAKVPIIMQLEALECGAACLAMVLAYYRKWIPLEEVRRDCGVSRDGSRATNILKAARQYGLDAKGYRFEPADLKRLGTFPCIVHWNFNHFVVLCGFKKNKAIINDPGRGILQIPLEEFDEAFTGVALMFTPNDSFSPSGAPKSMVRFAAERLKGARAALIFVVLTSAIASLIGVVTPGFSRVFLDRLLTHQNPEWFMPFIVALACLSAISLLVQTVNTLTSLKLNGKMAVLGNAEYMWKILRLPIDFFSQRLAGDIDMRRASNAHIANSLIGTFAPQALNAIMAVFYLVVMLRYSELLTIIGLTSILINMWMSNVIARKHVNISRVQMRDASKLSSMTLSGISMIETIKASGAENGFFEKWAGYQASVNTQTVRYARISEYLGLIPHATNALTGAAVLFTGVFLCIEGSFSVGMVMAFQGILSSFTTPVLAIIESSQILQEMRTEMERIEDVMTYPLDPTFNSVNNELKDYKKLSGRLELRGISFGYNRLDPPLITDFDLSITPGSRVALVGASGCGKSTIAKLISGLYQPWKGEILFDGIPLSQIDRSILTGSLAVVDQEVVLFEDTIENNIKMWDQSIEDFEMILAARDAQIYEDIMRRDGGFRYQLREEGRDFSGGQRQRLEIARVLAQDPTIVILDEATAALDAKTEYEVVKAIADRGITCIIVAHRLSTIRDCDEILVLDHGTVVERGTHNDLYMRGGQYTRLVASE